MKLITHTMSDTIIVIILMFMISCAICSVTYPYAINTWLVYIGKPEAVQWWHGCIIEFCRARI